MAPTLDITRGGGRRSGAAILALAACLLGPVAGGRAAADEAADEASERNAWPFPGLSAAEVADYIDERASVVAVNLMLGTVIITVQDPGGGARTVELPLGRIDAGPREIVPIVPVRASREAAMDELPRFRRFRERGLTPVLLYREDGLIWPTVITPETAPRILAVYPKALAAAQKDARATRDAFIHVAFWYVGARFPGSTRTRADSAGKEAGRVIIPRGRKVSDAERQIMHKLAAEGRTVKALRESTVPGKSTADFLVDGIKTELKTVSNITSPKPARALKNTIEDAAKQAPHIIVDVRRQAGATADFVKEVAERTLDADKARRRIRQIRLIGDGFDFTVLPKWL